MESTHGRALWQLQATPPAQAGRGAIMELDTMPVTVWFFGLSVGALSLC